MLWLKKENKEIKFRIEDIRKERNDNIDSGPPTSTKLPAEESGKVQRIDINHSSNIEDKKIFSPPDITSIKELYPPEEPPKLPSG